jgi:membrane protease subunit (stomatin/prohibitin family)
MALWDKLKSQLIDIIEWLDDTQDTMVWRFWRPENEIMNGAKLIVREGQVAAFVNQGQLADVFLPGTYDLHTRNLPILSKLAGWSHGFESPFKAEVYFVSTRVFTDRKWGTKNPIMMRDPEFGPIRLRAFGSFAIKVKYPPVFLREIVGTNGRFSIDQINDQLRDMATSRFTDVLGSSKIAALDLAGNYDQLAGYIRERIQPDFAAFGMELVKFVVENISLPPEVEAALDKRTSMGVIGNLQAYTQFQAANAIGDAARNPSGIAGVGAGLGAGMAIGQQFTQAMNAPPAAGASAAAPSTSSGQAPASSAASASDMPPALPQETKYFAAIDGQQSGPFDRAKLHEAVAQGKLARETMVWAKGMPQWTAAAQVPALASLFDDVPPPLPKA